MQCAVTNSTEHERTDSLVEGRGGKEQKQAKCKEEYFVNGICGGEVRGVISALTSSHSLTFVDRFNVAVPSLHWDHLITFNLLKSRNILSVFFP